MLNAAENYIDLWKVPLDIQLGSGSECPDYGSPSDTQPTLTYSLKIKKGTSYLQILLVVEYQNFILSKRVLLKLNEFLEWENMNLRNKCRWREID